MRLLINTVSLSLFDPLLYLCLRFNRNTFTRLCITKCIHFSKKQFSLSIFNSLTILLWTPVYRPGDTCNTRRYFSNLRLSFFGELLPFIATGSWNMMWSSVMVAYASQGLLWCPFWDVFLFNVFKKKSLCASAALCKLESIRSFFSELAHQQGVDACRSAAQWMFFVFHTISCNL